MSSIYDFAGDSYEAPLMPQKPVSETPHANRQDLSKPYVGRHEESKQESSSNWVAEKTNAAVEFWKFFTRQITSNCTAQTVNRSFTRNEINGDNYEQQKAKYIRLYNEQVKL